MPSQAFVVWPWLHLAGRVLFGSFFLVFGLYHLINLRAATEYFEGKRIPGAGPMVVFTGLMLLVGGVLVVLGWHRFIGAGLLFLVVFPGAWALHPFWKETDPHRRRSEMAQFFMTLALAGATLFVAYYGYQGWPLSVGG